MVIAFILFFAAAAALFYFGWVQFDLPENTYAVMFSKTGGYDNRVIEPGRFNWRWERILPTNSKLIKMVITTQRTALTYDGALPSGDLYGSVLPEKPDFSYKMNMELTYRLKEEKLPDLVRTGILDGGDLSGFYKSVQDEFLKTVKDETTGFFNQSLSLDNSSYGKLEEKLTGKLASRFPYIDFQSLVIKNINYPDLDLYSKCRDLYNQILDRRKESEIATEKWAIESKADLDTKLEILSRYGELLTKYPILVDYFALDPSKQVLEISNLKDYVSTGKADQ